jgi:hypothetical protein
LISALHNGVLNRSLELIQRGEQAATKIDFDEASTRALIDQQLRDTGWEADTKSLRYANGTRPAKGRNLAIGRGTPNWFLDLSNLMTTSAMRYCSPVLEVDDEQ